MVKQKLIMTKGLPGSGKTTWALEQVEKGNGHVKRVNKDDLRDMIDAGKHSKEREERIKLIQHDIILSYLEDGKTVIVDNTHFAEKWEKWFKELADAENVTFEVKDFTHVSLKECIRRDLLRGEKVGEKAIRKMYNQHIRKKPVYDLYNVNLPDCIICDIDGTLAHMTGRSPYALDRVDEDSVDQHVAQVVNNYFNQGYKVILFTARHERARDKTIDWLVDHGILFSQLVMRGDEDYRADSVVKKEMYEEKVKGEYNVLFVLDDRDGVVDMWRENGVKCFQVERGDF